LDELKQVRMADWVRRHADSFFPGGQPRAELCTAHVVGDILFLAGTDIRILRSNSWTLIASEMDWLSHPKYSPRYLLTEGAPFPEAGVNGMRFSVLLGVYSSVLVTVRGQDREVIKGDVDTADPIWELMQKMENAARVVAFTFAV
jgi:hypothetical protein